MGVGGEQALTKKMGNGGNGAKEPIKSIVEYLHQASIHQSVAMECDPVETKSLENYTKVLANRVGRSPLAWRAKALDIRAQGLLMCYSARPKGRTTP